MNGVREVGVRIKVGADGLGEAEKLSRSLKDLGTDTQELDNKATELGAELAKLGAQQQLIDNFKRSKTAAEEAARALQEAQAQAQKLGREFGAAEEPTKRQATALQRAREEVNRAKTSYTDSTVALQGTRKALSDAGLSSDDLANAQVRVRKQTADTQQQVTELTNRYRAAEGVARLNAEQQQRLAKETTAAGAAAQRSAGQQAAAGQQVSNSLEGVQSRLTQIGRLAAGGVLGVGSVQFLQSVTQTADAFNSLRARMQLVTGEGPALQQALEGVEQIALRTGSNLENTGNLFARVLTAGRELGLAQEDALALTESINQAVAVSGASAAASDAALTQLIQGLQSGVLRGEEFNSVIEQAPRLAQALADGLGVTRGELRGLANDGQLSAERVIQALTSQRETLQREFEGLPQTVGRAVENLNTSWTTFIGNLDDTTGFTDKVATGINWVAQNIDTLASVAARAGAVVVAALAVQAAGAVRKLGADALEAAGNFGRMLTSIEKVPKTVNIAIAVVGLEVGFQIGTLLRENSELARKLGVGVTEFFVNITRDLQFVAEAAAAIFTDDTVGEAFDRWKKRAEEQKEIFDQLYKDAEQSPAAVAAATEEAQRQSENLGQTVERTGGKINAAGKQGAAGVQQIGQAAEGAAGAISSLVDQASAKLPAAGSSARIVALDLAKVAEASDQAAERIAKGLPEAIAKLNGSELAEFGSALRASLGEGERGAKLLQTALVAVAEQAAKSLGVEVATASNQVSASFENQLDNLALLIRSFPALERSGVDTARLVGDALSKMIDGARNRQELDALRLRIEALGTAGQLSAEQIDTAFQALNEAREKLDDLQPGIQNLNEAARKAGVEVERLVGGLSRGAESSVKAVADLITEIIKTRIAAEQASPVLGAALTKRVQAAQTADEVLRLRQEIERAAGAGKLFGSDLEIALEAVKRKAQELSPAFQQAAADARRLGVELSTGLERSAEDGLRAYERLKLSGKATATQIEQAFVNLANEQIKAADGVVPEWVKVEAAIRGSVLRTDEYGRVAVLTFKQATQEAEQAARATGEVGRQAQSSASQVANLADSFGRLASGATSAGNAMRESLQASGGGGFGLLSRDYLAQRNAGVPTGPSAGSFGELLNNTPSGGITRTVDTGQAVNRPSGGEWTYTLTGFSVAGRDAAGNPLAGGWVRVSRPSAITAEPFGGMQQLPFGGLVPRGSVGGFSPAGAPPFGTRPAPATGPQPAPQPAPAPEPEGRATPSSVVEIRLPRPGDQPLILYANNQQTAAQFADLLQQAFRANGGALPG